MVLLTAEDDVIISTRRAGEDASGIVLGIAVRLWALPLEEFGIVIGNTVVVCVGSRAAVLRGIQLRTRTVASICYFQFCRAGSNYVVRATYFLTVRRSCSERDIETFNQRHVIEVLILVLIERIFKKSLRRTSIALTIEQPPAVTGVALALPVSVEGAAGTTPDSRLRCSCRNVESPRLALRQCLTAARTCSGPNCVWALVRHHERRPFSTLQINIDGE